MVIKSYTDLEQSNKLKEFLPIESADRHYWLAWRGGISKEYKNIPKVGIPKKYIQRKNLWCPCWSLAALFSVIRKTIGYTLYGVNNVYISCELGDFRKIETEVYDNEVDACFEMVLKLHELKWL